MFRKLTTLAVTAACALVFAGCGTIFYGERIGQKSSDKIDPTVLVLDCCGLLFGIIPGVVALAVDFSNRTIYYTASEANSESGATLAMILLRPLKF